jgi:hypothetical protein
MTPSLRRPTLTFSPIQPVNSTIVRPLPACFDEELYCAYTSFDRAAFHEVQKTESKLSVAIHDGARYRFTRTNTEISK